MVILSKKPIADQLRRSTVKTTSIDFYDIFKEVNVPVLKHSTRHLFHGILAARAIEGGEWICVSEKNQQPG